MSQLWLSCWYSRRLLKLPKVFVFLPQNDTSEDVFEFTTNQLLAVVDFIVLEASQSHDMSHGQDAANESMPMTSSQSAMASTSQKQNVAKATSPEKGGVSSRLDLLLSCVCDSDDRIRAIVSHVQNQVQLVTRYVTVMTASEPLSHMFRAKCGLCQGMWQWWQNQSCCLTCSEQRTTCMKVCDRTRAVASHVQSQARHVSKYVTVMVRS